MKLSFEEISGIVTGAVRIEQENGLIKLYRFTKEQEELYKTLHSYFYEKLLSSAGIKLLFKTNSKNLYLKIMTSKGSSRTYFSVDVFVNGKFVDAIDNFSGVTMSENYTQMEFPIGSFSKEFYLGEGTKTVCIYLPWSLSTAIDKIVIDDDAFVESIKPQKKLIAFGDSITQGYDAMRPSNRYISKLSEKLGAIEYNKAIGGEGFFPELAGCKDEFLPDYITVAYGTNDWSCLDKETLKNNAREFYYNLKNTYPLAKIFAITPIWRKDINGERPSGPFETVEEEIRNSVKGLGNVTVIRGIELVPNEEKYFGDLRLHPNDEGFEYYSKRLFNKIKEEI